MLSRVLLGVTATATVSVGGGYYWAKKAMGDDSVSRLIAYNKVVSPAIMEYKWEEAKCEKLPKVLPWLFPPVPKEEQDKRFEKLHEKWTQPLFDCFMELGGFYYKSGQKIASNFGGVWPQRYTETFQPFLNQIPARTPEQVRKVVEDELCCKREEIFSSWDDEPIGCASIGQVHRAVLKRTGQRVVVKVQNPEAERTFKGDVFSLKVVVDMFMPQFSVAFDEISKQFATEFDYRGECKNTTEIKRNLQNGGFDVIVPEVLVEYCTPKLMVMEEIYPATPLHDALEAQTEAMAKQQGISKAEFVAFEKAQLEEESRALAKEGKTIESIMAEDYDKYIRFQTARRFVTRGLKHFYNYTLGWGFANYDLEDDGIIIPLNAARLIDDLLAVHGHEVLIDGCFNADPHPGNILCTDGKLALIDYGQVKHIEKKDRISLAKCILLVEAAIKVDPRTDPNVRSEVHERARQSIYNHSVAIGMKTKKMLPRTLYEMMTVYMGRMDAAWVYPFNIIQWTDDLQATDPIGNIKEVDYFVMVNTATMMLRGLGEMLRQPRNLAHVWEPYARKALEQEGLLEDVEREIASWHE